MTRIEMPVKAGKGALSANLNFFGNHSQLTRVDANPVLG